MTSAGRSNGDYVVDVGIPTLGDSPFLVEAVESVLSQTFSDWRLLVLENGPGSDRTRAELEPYLVDPRIRHVVTGATVGRGENWTNLLRAGSAPYVGILHDDDRWHPPFLERRVAFLEQYQSCGLVYSGFNMVDATGRALGRSKVAVPAGVLSSAYFLPRLYTGSFIAPPTLLVRRSAYEAVGAQFAELIILDWEMWLRLAARFDVGFLELWDNDYRYHGGQTSANRAALGEHFLRVLDLADTLPLPAPLRRKVRTEWLVKCALNAVEQGRRKRAVDYLDTALHTDISQFLRPKTAARALVAVTALATGARGRRLLTRVRTRRWWSGGAEGFLPPVGNPSNGEPSATSRLRGIN
jgi:glycosyltransferase involved in cell wall biosynthesis